MSEPRRIQRKRTKGWRMPEGAIYVGRPSRWGNPWRVGDPFLAFYPALTARTATLLFERSMDLKPAGWADPLRGHDLVCWCPLDQPCHADVLLKLANSGRAAERNEAAG